MNDKKAEGGSLAETLGKGFQTQKQQVQRGPNVGITLGMVLVSDEVKQLQRHSIPLE